MYAKIIPLTKIPLSRPQVYTYNVDDFKDQIKVGQVVSVPLYNRQTSGIVKEIFLKKPNLPRSPGQKEIIYKKITKIFDQLPLVNEQDLALVAFAQNYYYGALGLFLKHAVPEPLKRVNKKLQAKLAELNLSAINKASKKIAKTHQPILATGTLNERQDYYLKIMEKAVAEKKQVLLLAPEVALLAQTEIWLKKQLPTATIVTLHGSANKSTEILHWRQAQTNASQIFIGTRRAIFTSFYDLDYIIIDEEADLSYKQWDMNPRYDARLLAEHKAKLYQAQLIYGGNAPSLTNFLRAEKQLVKKENLTIDKNTKPNLTIVDLRRELHGGNYSILSLRLQDSLAKTLAEKKQALVFVSQRAASVFVLCRDCGHIIRCPNCQTALVEHSNRTLSCASCSVKMASPLNCPECKSTRIKGFGIGIEKVEKYFQKQFPKAILQKMATGENTSYKKLIDMIKDWQNGQIDILITTQIGTRLSAPNLDLITAINIDSVLNFPDWRNDEKAWQMLHALKNNSNAQKIVIQTYKPDSALLQAILAEQKIFYQKELQNRKALAYPPFVKMIKLICRSDDYDFLINETNRVAKTLRQKLPQLKIIGPTQPINAKIRYFWYKHLILKLDLNEKNAILEDILINLSNLWSIDVDPLT